MPSVNEIFTKAQGHLRAIAGDSVEIVKKALDKLASKLDENSTVIKDAGDKTESAIKTQEKAVVGALKDVKKSIDAQEVAENVTIKNPEAITGDLKKGLEGIINTLKEEVKNFDKEVIVKNDLGQLATLFKGSRDKKAVISALKDVVKAVNNSKAKELPDTSFILNDILEAIVNKKNDKIEILLKELRDKDINLPNVFPVDLDPNLVEKDRVKTILPDEQVERMSAILQEGNNSSEIIAAINNISDQQVATDLEGKGKTSVGTTAAEVAFTGTTESLLISADTDNTGTLYVGKSDVASDGSNAIAFLEAGESLKMDYNDTTNTVYVVASAASQNFWAGALL